MSSLAGRIHQKEFHPKLERFKPWQTPIPQIQKRSQLFPGFVNYYRTYFARMAEKFSSSYKKLKAEVPINITSALKVTFVSVNKAPSDACEMALKQPNSRKTASPV